MLLFFIYFFKYRSHCSTVNSTWRRQNKPGPHLYRVAFIFHITQAELWLAAHVTRPSCVHSNSDTPTPSMIQTFLDYPLLSPYFFHYKCILLSAVDSIAIARPSHYCNVLCEPGRERRPARASPERMRPATTSFNPAVHLVGCCSYCSVVLYPPQLDLKTAAAGKSQAPRQIKSKSWTGLQK